MQFFQYYEDDRMGIRAENGEVILPAEYDIVEGSPDGFFTASLNGRFAWFDESGHQIIPFSDRFEYGGQFSEGLAIVRKNGLYGYIDRQGNEVITPRFLLAENFRNGLAIARNTSELHGMIDKTGRTVIEFKYAYLTQFHNGYAQYGDMQTWGLVNREGEEVTPQIYQFIGEVTHDNKVTVQILEGDEYREGILNLLTGETEWNNNLDALNAFNRTQREFSERIGMLIDYYFHKACPCAYPRFRKLITWHTDQPVRLFDQELAFNGFTTYCMTGESSEEDVRYFACPVCKTEYASLFTQYNAFLWVQSIEITKIGNAKTLGASPIKPMPVVLGLQGFELEGFETEIRMTDTDEMIRYLSAEL